jgi:hypothetical protein
MFGADFKNIAELTQPILEFILFYLLSCPTLLEVGYNSYFV